MKPDNVRPSAALAVSIGALVVASAGGAFAASGTTGARTSNARAPHRGHAGTAWSPRAHRAYRAHRATGPAGPTGPRGAQGAQGPIGPPNAYEVYRDSGPSNIPSTPTTGATLANLPAGAYAITAKAELDVAATDGLPAPRILCQVNALGAVAQGEGAGGLAMSVTLPVEVTHTFSGHRHCHPLVQQEWQSTPGRRELGEDHRDPARLRGAHCRHRGEIRARDLRVMRYPFDKARERGCTQQRRRPPLRTALEVSVGRSGGSCGLSRLVGLDSGGGIRTRDLRVMSPTSYQTAPPRGGPLILAAVGGIGEKNAARGRVEHRGSRRGARGVPAGQAGTSFEARTSAIEPASCSRTLDIGGDLGGGRDRLGFAQLEPLDLARRGPREVVDERDARGGTRSGAGAPCTMRAAPRRRPPDPPRRRGRSRTP